MIKYKNNPIAFNVKVTFTLPDPVDVLPNRSKLSNVDKANYDIVCEDYEYNTDKLNTILNTAFEYFCEAFYEGEWEQHGRNNGYVVLVKFKEEPIKQDWFDDTVITSYLNTVDMYINSGEYEEYLCDLVKGNIEEDYYELCLNSKDRIDYLSSGTLQDKLSDFELIEALKIRGIL